ncbi:MAG: type II toxin-antitoxin system VapB family antitoxin [Bacteroidota bacterium]
MRTTLDLPQDLVDQALKVTGIKTKSQLIKTALELLIERDKRLKLLSFKGSIDLDIDLDDLRQR